MGARPRVPDCFTQPDWLICIGSIEAVLEVIPLWEFETLVGVPKESGEEFLVQARAG